MTVTWLKRGIKHLLTRKKLTDTASEAAYDLWASAYDSQPDNLMLALDEQVFSSLLNGLNLTDKIIADIGCGTGRHWKKILDKNPAKLTGYDVSEAMLHMLQQKFPQANTIKINDGELPKMAIKSVDVIVSTLTIAHIAHLDALIAFWANSAKTYADIIITDFHPDALAFGGKRTFEHQNSRVSIKNYVHPICTIVKKFAAYGFRVAAFEERFVDEFVKHYYEKKHALSVYEKFKGKPIIYGLHLTRSANAAA